MISIIIPHVVLCAVVLVSWYIVESLDPIDIDGKRGIPVICFRKSNVKTRYCGTVLFFRHCHITCMISLCFLFGVVSQASIRSRSPLYLAKYMHWRAQLCSFLCASRFRHPSDGPSDSHLHLIHDLIDARQHSTAAYVGVLFVDDCIMSGIGYFADILWHFAWIPHLPSAVGTHGDLRVVDAGVSVFISLYL